MLIKWNEPLFSREGDILGNSVVSATKEDVINWRRKTHKYPSDMSDEDVLDEFKVVYWAWEEPQIDGYFVSGPETSFVVYEHKDIEPFLTALYMCGMIDDKNDYTATKISFEYKETV